MTPYQTIAPQTGTALKMKAGEILEVMDPQGEQVSDLFCVSVDDFKEVFSASRSMDYADTIFLTQGHVLYSNRSRPMLTILKDMCGRHDLLMPPCSLRMFQIVAGNEAYHPSCHENLAINMAHFGIEEDFVGTTFNLFMNVSVDPQGRVSIGPPTSQAGHLIRLRAEMDLIVGLTACSHEETNNGTCKPICYRILQSSMVSV